MKRIMLVLGALVVSAGVLMAEQKEWTNKCISRFHLQRRFFGYTNDCTAKSKYIPR